MAQADRASAVEAAGTVRRAMPVRRVKKAYEQVADQVRELILAGDIAPDERLPSEAALATEFGVSRATIREALRVLSTQSLVRTAKGSRGGSFVTIPTVDHVATSLGATINLLSRSADVTLEELLELRELLEIPAARLAALRCDEELLERLRAAIPGEPGEPDALGADEHFAYNRDFHSVLLEAAGNTLLTIAAEPIFTVLQTHLRRSTLGDDFHACVDRDHRAILAALERNDTDAAAGEMRDHLAHLRLTYERVWRYRRRELD